MICMIFEYSGIARPLIVKVSVAMPPQAEHEEFTS